MIVRRFLWALLAVACTGCCGAGLDRVRFDHHESDDRNFELALGQKPASLKVLNSAYVTYAMRWWAPWHLFSNTSPDWAFELLAPAEWVEKQKRDIPLRRRIPKMEWFDSPWATELRTRWFRPDREHYDIYYEYLPSIPYHILFVDRKAREDGLLHVFFQKR